jgi:hypothetical protein
MAPRQASCITRADRNHQRFKLAPGRAPLYEDHASTGAIRKVDTGFA